MKTFLPLLAFLLPLLAGTGPASADLPGDATLVPALESDAKNRFTRPVCMQEVPGKPGHFLVAEHGGNVFALVPAAGGGYGKSSFLQLPVGPVGTKEQGLYSLALHPSFASNRKYYLNYAPPAATGMHLMVEEREADASLLKDSGKPPRTLLSFPAIVGSFNHNHGHLLFGPDGMLYASIGYGGNDGDLRGWGQDLGQLMGKILRLDVDGADAGLPYRIPADNPLVGRAGARAEIWAYGLRNPWRMAWDMAARELWLGDVGDQTQEEIDIVRKGENLGWNTMEGDLCFRPLTAGCAQEGLVKPVRAFTRSEAKSIIGGVVFRGDSTSAFHGAYIFGDYGFPRIWAVTHANRALKEFKLLAEPASAPLAFAQDSKSNVYVLTLNAIYKLAHPELRPASPPVPVISGSGSVTGNAGLAGFFVEGQGGYSLRRAPETVLGWELYSLQGRLMARGTGDRVRVSAGIYHGRLQTPAGYRTGLVLLD